MEVACPYKNKRVCEIASELAALPVIPGDDACNACTQEPRPQAENRVTASLAIMARRQAGFPATEHLLKAATRRSKIGDALAAELERERTRLSRLALDWLLPEGDCAECVQMRDRLNAMTAEQVLSIAPELAAELNERWDRLVSAVRYFPLRRRIIARVLRRAVRTSLKS